MQSVPKSHHFLLIFSLKCIDILFFAGLLTQSDDMSNSTLIPTRKQTNATNLDGKIIKSLKKQEEKRDKRAARKKEVNSYFFFLYIFLIHLLSLSTFFV